MRPRIRFNYHITNLLNQQRKQSFVLLKEIARIHEFVTLHSHLLLLLPMLLLQPPVSHSSPQKKKADTSDEDANALKRNVVMTEHMEEIEALLERLKTDIETGKNGKSEEGGTNESRDESE